MTSKTEPDSESTKAGSGAETTGSGATTDSGESESAVTGPSESGSTTGASEPCPAKVWMGDFTGLPAELTGFTEVTGFVRVEMTDAQDLHGMECIERIGSVVILRGNAAMKSLDGLERLEYAGGFLISDNAALENIRGLQSLREIMLRLTLSKNPKLASLNGLGSLISIGEMLEIVENASLKNLEGLTALTSVAVELTIYSNASLVDCSGLDSLTSTGGVNVTANPNLVSLKGLEHIVELGYTLQVRTNPVLTDVTALLGAKMMSPGDLEITGNTALPQCDAEALAAAVKPMGFMGQEDVSGNLGTCP